MTIFYLDEDYELDSKITDRSKVGILVFCGVGLAIGGIQINEFSKTFDGTVSLVFIKDLKRSWWNNGNYAELLDKAITHLKVAGCERFFTIGNSMGGTGALLASHVRSDIERVYAFVPQADPYNDRRWNQYTDLIENIKWSNFAKLQFYSDVHIFMGNGREDEFQCGFFEKEGKKVHYVNGAEHNVAQVLKERGEYRSIIDQFLQ